MGEKVSKKKNREIRPSLHTKDLGKERINIAKDLGKIEWLKSPKTWGMVVLKTHTHIYIYIYYNFVIIFW